MDKRRIPSHDAKKVSEEGHEQRALRLAEGKLSSDEKEAIAEGKAVDRMVRSKLSHHGFESKALRIAEGKLNREEKRAIADGDGILHAKNIGDVKALRFAVGELNSQERRAIAEGKVDLHADKHESKALLLAEGKISLDATGEEASGTITRPTAHKVDDLEAIRLAEGEISNAQKRRIADGMTTSEVRRASASSRQSRSKPLTDMTPSERSKRIDHLLEVARQIGARKYKARAQELAQSDDMMMRAAP
jgi:phenylpyruvate tautomerase PptA (4-oxalocrotonate tautomerase family)